MGRDIAECFQFCSRENPEAKRTAKEYNVGSWYGYKIIKNSATSVGEQNPDATALKIEDREIESNTMNIKMIKIFVLAEIAFLLLWVLVEGVYTKSIFAYLFLLTVYFFIFRKVAPEVIRGIKDVFVCLPLIFSNTFMVSLICMEVADYFSNNNSAVSKLGLTYKSLIWKGYSLFYASIVFGLLSLILLLFLKIVRK